MGILHAASQAGRRSWRRHGAGDHRIGPAADDRQCHRIPIGICAGIFLAEFGSRSSIATAIRFTADVLNGVPSIVVGIAVSALIVLPQKHYSAFAGGVALGIMMIPNHHAHDGRDAAAGTGSIREAALGLGLPHWRSVLSITCVQRPPAL